MTHNREVPQFQAKSSGRLDHLLTTNLSEMSRTKVSKLIQEGAVTVEGKTELKSGFFVKEGWTVEITLPDAVPLVELEPAEIALDIRYEDDDLIIVNKPRGLASHPAPSLREPSLVNALLARQTELSQMGGHYRPGIVHRLDKETTGLMVVAKSDVVHAHLAKQFERKTAERRYVGMVEGEVERERFDIQAPIGRDPRNRQRMAIVENGKSALTHCRVLKHTAWGTLLACRLSTGRTHQIRVHLRALGHSILGDATYGTKSSLGHPLQLHAGLLRLEHPRTKAILQVEAEPPDDFLGKETLAKIELPYEWPTD